jgi:hypothetical protein
LWLDSQITLLLLLLLRLLLRLLLLRLEQHVLHSSNDLRGR